MQLPAIMLYHPEQDELELVRAFGGQADEKAIDAAVDARLKGAV